MTLSHGVHVDFMVPRFRGRELEYGPGICLGRRRLQLDLRAGWRADRLPGPRDRGQHLVPRDPLRPALST